MKFNQALPAYLSKYFFALDVGVSDLNLSETLATCSDCRMAKPQPVGSLQYKPNLKCCTFWPELSNHQIGAILVSKEKSTEKHNVCLPKILQKLDPKTCNPIGIQPSLSYKTLFEQHRSKFGQHEDLLCPYYDRAANACGIWPQRGGICTSYYCISDRGQVGLQFWNSLGQLQVHLEIQLAQYLLPFMGLSSRWIRLCIQQWFEPEENFNFQELYSELKIDPKEFYRKCYEHLQSSIDSPITSAELNEILGPEGLRLSENFLNDLNAFKGQ